MTCLTGKGFAVCGVGPHLTRRSYSHCPTCERRTGFVVSWRGVYYGENSTCVSCGDTWCDGEMFQRPFKRGWRAEAKRNARTRWNTAISTRAYKQHAQEEMRLAFDAA